MEPAILRLSRSLKGGEGFPPCVRRILSMSLERPTHEQSFYLACFLLDRGFDIDECKRVFREIFGCDYDEVTADLQLKFIEIKGIKPYNCFMVRQWLGVCSPNCPKYRSD